MRARLITLGWFAFALLLALGLSHCARAQPSRAVQDRNGTAIVAWLREHLDLRETTGYNRDPLIDSWARKAGNALASEWCGLTQMANQIAQKLPYPAGPAGSYNWFKLGSPRNVLRGTTGSFDSARVGYRVGIFNARRGRIAHITAIEEVYKKRQGNRPRGAWCIGGNEGSGKNAGVHRTFYPAVNIYALSNWNY